MRLEYRHAEGRGYWHYTQTDPRDTDDALAIAIGYSTPPWFTLVLKEIRARLMKHAAWRAPVMGGWGGPTHQTTARATQQLSELLARLTEDIGSIRPEQVLGAKVVLKDAAFRLFSPGPDFYIYGEISRFSQLDRHNIAAMSNFTTNRDFQEAFWETKLELPPGLKLQRQHSFWTAQRPGPGGSSMFELVTLRAPAADSKLLVAYKAPLTAKDVPGLKKRMAGLLEERRRSVDGEDRLFRFPVVATDSAQPAVREACEREWLGLIDQTGTIIIHDGPVYVHVEGKGRTQRRTRATLFRGKGARILRLLLELPGVPHSVSEVGEKTDTSNAYAFAVLTRLEEQGFVQRRSPRSGFRLIRPVDLLEAWLNSDPRNVTLTEPFYSPSTSAGELDRLAQRLGELKTKFALTLMSAVAPSDVATGGLPHGLYLAGDVRPVVELLGLRKTTPHNFLILRPEPEAATDRFGVFRKAHRTVSTPQLILDLATHGGPRGPEQATTLLQKWSATFPSFEADD